MRDRTMKLRRDRIKLKYRYLVYDKKIKDCVLKEDYRKTEAKAILADLVTDKPKGRELFILNLAKTYVRDYELSGDKKFFDTAVELLKLYIKSEPLVLPE